MYCENCGNKLPDGARFCGNCGAAVSYNAPVTAPATPPTQAEAPAAPVPQPEVPLYYPDPARYTSFLALKTRMAMNQADETPDFPDNE